MAGHTTLTAGTRLGHYEIIEPIGAGGMGVVYRARDPRLDREVAVKVMADTLARDAEAVHRFEREARAVAALSHPNILALHDIGQADGTPFAVTELLDGESLRARLRRGALPWRQAAAIARAMADGLAFAHARGIVHRDLKPENVFLTSDGRVKILDFGLARTVRPAALAAADDDSAPTIAGSGAANLDLHGISPTIGTGAAGAPLSALTMAGIMVGTIGYAAPEQVRGGAIGPAADIFSLGCVLYEMAAGRRAFEAPTGIDTLAALLEHDAPAIETSGHAVPPELERIVFHCLEKVIANRFQSARDLGIALDALLSDSGITSTASGTSPNLATPNPSSSTAAAAHATPAIGSGRHAGTTSPLSSSSSGRAKTTKTRGRSLAVLPFTTDDESGDAAYLSDGITESLINSLSSIPRLRVVPRSTVFRLKGRDLDPHTIGEELGVKTLLTGRIVTRGDSLIIQAELVDVAQESQLWGQHYTRPLSDILSVQDTIAREISDALKLKLTGSEQSKLAKRTTGATGNTDAYQDYLRGRYFFNKYTPDGFDRAIECYEEAIKKDPHYALAHAGLADTYGTGAFFGYMVPDAAVQKAHAAVNQAMAIDPQLPEANYAAAKDAFFFRRDWATTGRALEHALDLNPRAADARMFYAMYLFVVGQKDKARAQAQQALDDDPLSGFVNTGTVMIHLFSGTIERGLALGQRALQLDPEFLILRQVLAIAYEKLGQFDKAIALIAPTMMVFGNVSAESLEKLSTAYHEHGARGYWEQRLRGMRDLAARRYVPPFMFGYLYAMLGDRDRAFEYLDRAFEVASGMLVFVGVHPGFTSLHADPRFDALLKRMGLPPTRRGTDSL